MIITKIRSHSVHCICKASVLEGMMQTMDASLGTNVDVVNPKVAFRFTYNN